MASYSISVMRNDGSSALFELHPGKVTIGQQRGEIATLDPTVADPHGELHFDGRTVTYVDMGSPAGSFLPSGERISAPLALQPGGIVSFGACKLMVQEIRQDTGAAPAPLAPAPVAPQAPYAAPMPQQPAQQQMQGAPLQQQMQQPGQPAPAYGLPPAAPLASAATPNDPPAGAGVVDQLVHHLRVGATSYKKHYLNGVLTIGLIVIPAALLNAALGWIPVVGVIVAIVLGLAQLMIVPLSAGAMGRWALSTAAGQDLHWKKAWKSALKSPVQEWLNIFVAQLVTALGLFLLIVPGLIVGMFALPAYLLEGKTFFGINSRSAELVMKDAGGILGLGFLSMLSLFPVAILVVILGVVLAFVPLVGEPMAAFLGTALNVFAVPFLYLVWAQVYYATVRRLEATDPVVTHAATIASWAAAE